MNFYRHILCLVICWASCTAAFCKEKDVTPKQYSVGATVNPDNSITFAIVAPLAHKVSVTGNFVEKRDSHGKKNKLYKGGYKMTKHGTDWTYTTQPLKPEMYIYRFMVDGKLAIDTVNHKTIRDIKDRFNFCFVRDSITEHFLDKDIPHGKISKVWYPSTMNGMSQRRMFVYTPVGYDSCHTSADSTQCSRRYPVLYLLHGSGGDETSWSDYGRVCQILDQMIYNKEIEPLIVVMPNGNTNLDAAPGESPYMDKAPNANNMSSMFGHYESHFRHEIVEYIDKNYRTIPDKAHRAIAGLSLGGLHTIYTSLNNPDLFDYVGLFSPQTYNSMDEKHIFGLRRTAENVQRFRNIMSLIGGNLPHSIKLNYSLQNISVYSDLEQKLQKQFANPPKLYYVAIGKEDFLLTAPVMKKLNAKFFDVLNANGYKYEYHLSDGSHSWENWRRYLIDFLPRLFK